MFSEVFEAVVGISVEKDSCVLPGYERFKLSGQVYPGITEKIETKGATAMHIIFGQYYKGTCPALGERQMRIYPPLTLPSPLLFRCAGRGEGTVESAARPSCGWPSASSSNSSSRGSPSSADAGGGRELTPPLGHP